MCHLPSSRTGRQSTPTGTSAFACQRSSRLGLHAVKTTASAACCSTTTTQVLTPPPPLRSVWKQIVFSWSPRPHNYSPSLAPCDFFLFPQVQQRLKGKQFQGVEDARAFYEGVFSDMPQSTWAGAMVTGFERTTKCVHAEGGGGTFKKVNWARNSFMRQNPHIQKHMG